MYKKSFLLRSFGVFYEDLQQLNKAQEMYKEAIQLLEENNLSQTYDYGFTLYCSGRVDCDKYHLSESIPKLQASIILLHKYYQYMHGEVKEVQDLLE